MIEPRSTARNFTTNRNRQGRFVIRAAAHTLAEAMTRPAQRWDPLVTDEGVALVLYLIEADGAEFYRGGQNNQRWLAPASVAGKVPSTLSSTINEMIRTGLLRHVIEHGVDYLVPALVHLMDGYQSACRFTGEDLGPMRSRLVRELYLVDCLHCLEAVAVGHARGL